MASPTDHVSSPASASIPPPLPPTVEEAYRRKCVQLKHRTKEVENANDAAHLRLTRMKRQVEKMRLERAFLLEQLARRTSTNVEDSEGSPSPPPTPKEKPLRTKRGHRKGSLLANIETPPPAGGLSSSATLGPSGLLNSQSLRATVSPSSDAFSHSHGDLAKPNGTNGKHGKKGPNAFELYCEDTRPRILERAAPAAADDDDDDDKERRAANVEEYLARDWKNLSQEVRNSYQELADQLADQQPAKTGAKKEADAGRSPGDRSLSSAKPAARDEDEGGGEGDGQGAEDTPAQDEDVEMGNYDSDQETQGEKQDE